MIWVPQILRDQGHGKDYTKLPPHLQETCEGMALRKLAYYLEQSGKDYPEELPELSDFQYGELSREWQNAHKMRPDETERIYNSNKSSPSCLIVINCFSILRYGRN